VKEVPGSGPETSAAAGRSPSRPSGIRELAAELGISIGTISRALNGKPHVDPATRERILRAASASGYIPQQFGRSLREGSTRTIGLLWEIRFGREAYGDSFFLSLFVGVQDLLKERGYDLTILLDRPGSVVDGADATLRLRESVQRRQVDAFIIPWTRVNDPRLDYCAQHDIPFVALGRSESGGHHCWIDLDFEHACWEATSRLIARGHQRIGLVLASSDLMQTQFFIAGYSRAIQASGLSLVESLVTSRSANPGGGQQAVDDLMSLKSPPTAIIIIDMGMVVGAYRRLGERGIRCGRDIAVIGGVQDNPISEFLSPPLTCFGLDTTALGSRLAEAALAAIDRGRENSKVDLIEELWPLHLIVRTSDSC
jgi:DNA-binding LacI/PurR family transcriptional regulator